LEPCEIEALKSQLTTERAKSQKLVVAIKWWMDMPNDPEMQDAHEEAYDAVKQALSEYEAGE